MDTEMATRYMEDALKYIEAYRHRMCPMVAERTMRCLLHSLGQSTSEKLVRDRLARKAEAHALALPLSFAYGMAPDFWVSVGYAIDSLGRMVEQQTFFESVRDLGSNSKFTKGE